MFRKDPEFLIGSETLSYTFEDPYYLALFKDASFNLGELYVGLQKTADSKSVQDFKKRLLDRVIDGVREEHLGNIKEAFSNGSLGAKPQDLGQIVIPPRNLDGLTDHIGALIAGNGVLLEIRKNPEGNLAKSISGSPFGTINRPSIDQLEEYIADLERTLDFVQNPKDLDKADARLQSLFERAFRISRGIGP